MTPRMAHLVSVGALLAMLAGCTTVEQNLELRKPTARLVGVRFQEATLRAATVVFDVEVTNYYPVEVPLRGFRYSVSSEGRTFLGGSSEVRVNLPPNTPRTVSLPATVDYHAVLSALSNARPGGSVPYDARLTLTVDTPRLGPIGLDLDHAGSLTLPAISEVIPQAPSDTLKTQ